MSRFNDLRRDYGMGQLCREELDPDPIVQFGVWFDQLKHAEVPEWFEVNAMTLATSSLDGDVSSRIVLLKLLDRNGFSFFTNYRSDKARQIDENPRCSLTFFWPMFERQVRVAGTAQKTSRAISDLYFDSRPESSQLGAIASPQSQVITDDTALEIQIAELERQFAGSKIPRPDCWGGYCLTPKVVEFWQGKPGRLHDRYRYRLSDDNWIIERLAP